jgi:hypothetical protein
VQATLDQYGRDRSYMNCAESRTDAARIYDADTRLRPRALKREVDPRRVFKASQEIPPLM